MAKRGNPYHDAKGLFSSAAGAKKRGLPRTSEKSVEEAARRYMENRIRDGSPLGPAMKAKAKRLGLIK